MGVLCLDKKNRVEIQDFKDWKAGVYLIEAGCGMGKNYFVFNTLFPYAQQNGKRMLVFSNRVALREQQQAQTQEKDIKLITYQSLEHDEYLGTMQDTKDKVRGLMQQVGEYDYIILDEAHYLYQDAPFNKNTETIIELIEKYRSSKIIVLLSATPDLLKKYLRIDKPYFFKADYSYIKEVQYYTKRDTLDEIISKIPEDEKIVMFADSKDRLKELHSEYLVTGCSSPSTSNSNVESSVSSEVIQSVSNSDSGEVSNDSQEEFESLKDEAENLFEEGKYKEAVVAATKAYQLVEDKDGEEEIPLRVAEKLAEECGLKNPRAEIDTTEKSSTVNFIQINCDDLDEKSEDEIIRIYNELSDKSSEVIQAGGIEGKVSGTSGTGKTYAILGLVSGGKRYFVSGWDEKDKLVVMDDEDAQKRATEKKFSTGGSSNNKNTESKSNSTKSDVLANGDSKDSYGHDKFDAFVIAEKAVKDKLKSPSTAQFCTTTEATIGRNGNTWTVKGWVDPTAGIFLPKSRQQTM